MRRAVALVGLTILLVFAAGPAPDAPARDRCRVPADATDVMRGA